MTERRFADLFRNYHFLMSEYSHADILRPIRKGQIFKRAPSSLCRFLRSLPGYAMKKPRLPGQVEHVRQQYAALPFRSIIGLEIMLVTSRETRRWIIPKGWPMKGRRPRGTAAREALEEAGIKGKTAKSAIGSYTYIKRGLGGQQWPCRVEVFPLAVRSELADWRERHQRTRQWFPYIEAAAAVTEPELKSLILAFGVAFDRLPR